jgi:peroxiredoxin
MKKRAFLTVVSAFLIIVAATLFAKEKTIPSIKVKDLKGKTVDTKTFNNDGKPFVIAFWATWCKPCITELTAMNDVYEDWQDETGIKIITVSIDDSRNARKVPSFVRGRGWDYEVYVDENSDFRRAMSVNNPPHTFLVDGKGNIVWEHNGYAPGDEEELLKQIKKLCK